MEIGIFRWLPQMQQLWRFRIVGSHLQRAWSWNHHSQRLGTRVLTRKTNRASGVHSSGHYLRSIIQWWLSQKTLPRPLDPSLKWLVDCHRSRVRHQLLCVQREVSWIQQKASREKRSINKTLLPSKVRLLQSAPPCKRKELPICIHMRSMIELWRL